MKPLDTADDCPFCMLAKAPEGTEPAVLAVVGVLTVGANRLLSCTCEKHKADITGHVLDMYNKAGEAMAANAGLAPTQNAPTPGGVN